MQSLGSPFHSPKLHHSEHTQIPSWLEPIDPEAWIYSLQHVSLPEIEFHSHHPERPDSSAKAWESPADINFTLSSGGSSRSVALSFAIGEDGRASIENTLTSSNLHDFSEIHPQLHYTPHRTLANSEWNLSGNCLGMSSSPGRLSALEDLTQVSVSEVGAATSLSSSPPYEMQVHKAVKRTPLEIAVVQETKKRKRQSVISTTNARAKLKCISTSDIESDPSHEIMKLENDEYAAIKSRAQIEKIMFRGILRARKAFEEVCTARAMSIDGKAPHILQPVLREPELRPWNGKNSRKEAIKELRTTGISKSVRGFLRCSKSCDASFETYEDLAHHIDEYHGALARPYECPQPTCPWSIIGFSHFSECARHIASSHSERRFICELCELEDKSKSFTRTDALRRHISRTHHVNSVKRVKKNI